MTQAVNDNPIIVQSDGTILLEVESPRYRQARDSLASFAELEKAPEYFHTYRVTPLSVWNACAAGLSGGEIVARLRELAKYPPPEHILTEVGDYAARYGRLRILRGDEGLVLEADELPLAEELAHLPGLRGLLGRRATPLTFRIDPSDRGRLKQALVKAGFPADDQAGYSEGEKLDVRLRPTTATGEPFQPRRYQEDAAVAFHADGSTRGGSGVVVLPCGAGKTIVGIRSIDFLKTSTLILATNVTAVRQWIAEILDKTSLPPEMVGEYSGAAKDIRPVTVSTYQIMTYRQDRDSPFTHLALFDSRNWGLIIYDEVHLLPAPVFQVTATLQARRRLGLTATLVREDGREDDVFALIGPKRYDMPWKLLEEQGWIAKARCTELRVEMTYEERMGYAVADRRRKFRIASENPAKTGVVRELIERHAGERILILGMYVEQLRQLAEELGIPVLTGATRQARRDSLFADFRSGACKILICSKIANFSIDLPDASVAIQVSGTFGSRQEEAQRLGRILRPKPGANQASFYSLVSRETVEQDFAMNRQRFLCEQGYDYSIVGAVT